MTGPIYYQKFQFCFKQKKCLISEVGKRVKELKDRFGRMKTRRAKFLRKFLNETQNGEFRGKSRKENPQKLTQLSSRSHPRHLLGKRTAQKDTIIDIASDSQVNSNFPYRWSPASLTFKPMLQRQNRRENDTSDKIQADTNSLLDAADFFLEERFIKHIGGEPHSLFNVFDFQIWHN